MNHDARPRTDTNPPPSLFAEILVAVLTLVSIGFMFMGLIGLFSEGSGPMFAVPVLMLGFLFTVLFGVMWAKVAETRKQAKQGDDSTISS